MKIMLVGHGRSVPKYATAGSAGMDIEAAIPYQVTILPGSSLLIPAGFAVALDKGFEAQIRPRSGLALKHGITVLNSPGTIDSDYRGEAGVILHNTSSVPFKVNPGDRIAQMVIAPVTHVNWQLVNYIGTTDRGEGGFGSTGGNDGK